MCAITFMQDIYNYTLETNHVRRVCSVAAFLYLQFVLHVMSFHVLNLLCNFTFRSVCVCAVPKIYTYIFVVP
jgi:hypothetical protein